MAPHDRLGQLLRMIKSASDPPPLPTAPPTSPYYGEQGREKYEEKDYEEIYYHFDDYAQDIVAAVLPGLLRERGELLLYG